MNPQGTTTYLKEPVAPFLALIQRTGTTGRAGESTDTLREAIKDLSKMGSIRGGIFDFDRHEDTLKVSGTTVGVLTAWKLAELSGLKKDSETSPFVKELLGDVKKSDRIRVTDLATFLKKDNKQQALDGASSDTDIEFGR